MATRTFKIGEYARGGIITAETKGRTITIIGKEWDYSAGSNKGSDQSNAKEFTRQNFNVDSESVERELNQFIGDLTTSYYTGQIIDWLRTKIDFRKSFFW